MTGADTERPVSFLRRLAALWTASTLAVIAVLPYAFHLQAEAVQAVLEATGMSLLVLGGLSTVQSSVLFAVTAALGLWAGRAAGLRTPILDAWLSGRSAGWSWAGPPVLMGLGCGVLIVGLDAALAPLLPPEVRQATASAIPPAWKGMLACFYGGIAEEVLLRVFAMGVLAWLAGRLLRAEHGLHPAAAWTAILLATLLFGAGHLPTMANIAPLSPMVVVRVLLLNGVAGVVCGWLYWRRGIVPAMAAHFSADVVLHVILPLIRS